jgi:3-hydroxybutyryl-CoA dehydratase
MDNIAKILNYDEIKLGSKYSFSRTITSDDVLEYALLTGDQNPLHVNEIFAKKSQFGKNVVHGMLTASLFSTLVGMYCPGQNSLYLGQTLNFKMPLFYNETVLVSGIVLRKVDALKIIILSTEITRGHDLIVSGEARIQLIK